ncbi:MAG TPA: hypothetical protein VEG38_13810 [Acidimicrobiia bacterium]|nr:hypothetical protein [Acidimicrobiia bacterium]
MRKLLTLAIPMLLGVGLLTAAIHSDSPESERSQGGFAAASSQPAVIEEAAAPATTTTTAAPETTTTTAAPAAPAPTTTTTLAPVTTTTARRAVTPVTSRPRATTTTTTAAPTQTQAAAQPQVIDCGTGEAFARAKLAEGNVIATVVNDSTKAIELETLVVTIDYGGTVGQKRYTYEVSGKIVNARPGVNEASFSLPADVSGSAQQIKILISDFRFHTAGLPECTSH